MNRSASRGVQLLWSAAVLADSAALGAQSYQSIRRLELAIDAGWQANRGNAVMRCTNVPASLRYGVVNSDYRLTIDQRVTFMDRRIKGAPGAVLLDTEIGWRIGSSEKVRASVMAEYVFGGFNLTGASSYYPDAPQFGPLLAGLSGGIRTRVRLFQVLLRPELVLGRDLGNASRGSRLWVPPRTSIGLRLGYGFRVPWERSK